jgi:hypothetical protein
MARVIDAIRISLVGSETGGSGRSSSDVSSTASGFTGSVMGSA